MTGSSPSLERFLNDDFGYGRIEEIMSKDSTENHTIRFLLAGTWLGTFRAVHMKGASSELKITVPRIYSRADLEDQRKLKSYLRENQTNKLFERDPSVLVDEVQKREYFLSSTMALSITKEDVFRKIEDAQHKYFSGDNFRWNAIGAKFRGEIKGEDIYMLCAGPYTRYPKLLLISFNASKDFVEKINGIANTFNAIF